MNKKLKKRLAKAIASIDDTDGKEYWKWRWLPSPKKLGISNSNALAFRDLGVQSGQATWEDWEEKVKIMHPIRFFLIEELIPLIKIKWRRYIWEPWYWIRCHTMRRHRHHMLDLRQPKQDGADAYRYGWLDSDHKMVYALFNILNEFVAREMPHWHCPSEEEIEDDSHLLTQRYKYMEVKAIHYWWNVDRKRRVRYHDDLLHKWHKARQTNDPAEHQYWTELGNIEKDNKDKEDEMIARLLKIRSSLWT
jgi:hypothetical protein